MFYLPSNNLLNIISINRSFVNIVVSILMIKRTFVNRLELSNQLILEFLNTEHEELDINTG